MSDRESANIFALYFKQLASDPTEQHKKWAEEIWKETSNYDFSNYHLDCEDELTSLGLARKRVDPEYPEGGEVWFYGPEGNDNH